MREHPPQLPTAEAETDVSKGLSDALFRDARLPIVGTAITAITSLISYAITMSAAPLLIAIATVVVFCLRIFIAKRRQTHWLRAYDHAFGFTGIIYLFLIGMQTVWAVNCVDDQLVLTMSMMVSTLNAVSIALRFFVMKRFVAIQLIAILAPMVIGFGWRGGLFWIPAVMEILSGWFTYKSADRMHAMLLSEMTYRRSSEVVAAQFKFAIDNMPHGLCMIGPNMRVVVSNAKLAECLSLPATRSLDGVHFGALVRMARRRGTLGHDSASRLLATFSPTMNSVDLIHSEAPTVDGRVLELTLKRHDKGGWILVAQDVTEQKRAREALYMAARFDSVTGLPNRLSFEKKLSDVLLEARGGRLRTEVVFLDLDRFKQINDTLGHKFGDRVLAEAASRLRALMGENDFVARWGGDEFVVLRVTQENADAREFAEKIIRELSRPSWMDGTEIVIGASAGVADCISGVVSMDVLLQQADMALYTAKRADRGSCRIYEDSMSEKARERRLLELDLQAALASRTFELHYQPIVDIESGELVSFEALARWRHPVRGNVSPALFVPVLEDLNLMNAFGAWALQRACEDAVNWPRTVRVGVNASSKQLDTLADSVRRALAISGLAPDRLEIEITETAALAAGDAVYSMLESLRTLGVRVALDDFGTGYSSLSHLMNLPLDKVKIDRSFTQQLGKSRRADVLVANIARLASQLGMRVTFEGIETTDQLERARALGVAAEGQGWLFGKPTAVAELSKLFGEPASRVA